jgi:hypothetical protein
VNEAQEDGVSAYPALTGKARSSRVLPGKSLALIGNASGQGAEGATNCSEAFPIKANDYTSMWSKLVVAESIGDSSPSGSPLRNLPIRDFETASV